MKASFIILIVILDLMFVIFASALTTVSMFLIMLHKSYGYGHYIPIELLILFGAMVVMSIVHITIASVSSVWHCKGNVDFPVSKIMLAIFYVVHLIIFLICSTLEEDYFYYMRKDDHAWLKMLFFVAVPVINYFLLKLLVEKPALDYHEVIHSSFGK